MTYFLEIGPDRNVIQWEPHPLSDVMTECAPALTLEPTKHAEAKFSARRLTCYSDYKEVSWQWGTARGDWKRVKAQPYDAPGPSFELVRHPPQSNRITWEELSLCGSVELTPFDAGNKAGITERIERPLRLGPADVVCEDLLRGRIRVRLTRYRRPQDLRVRLLKLIGAAHEVQSPVYSFDAQGFCPIQLPNGFRGAVAIVHYRAEKERLMYYVGWTSNERLRDPQMRFQANGEPLDTKEWEEMRRCIEGEGAADSTATGQMRAWLEAWPSRSRQQLRGIYMEAVNSIIYNGDAARALRETPTGLFRTLVLYRCNYPFPVGFSELIKRLDIGSMEDALQSLSPELPSLLESVGTVEAKKWLITHAHHPKLGEAVEWAGSGGSAEALKQALNLIGLRDSVKERKDKLRHGTREKQEAQEILDKIQDAPFDDSPVEELEQKFSEIARAVEAEEHRAVNPEHAPPITVREYREWVEKRNSMEQWRGQLFQILTYCASGEWRAPAGNAASVPSFTELLEKVKRLKPPREVTLREPLRLVKDHALELSESARTLIEQQSHEPSEELRALACERLRTAVIGHAAAWAPMHEQIRLGKEKSVNYRWFAQCLGLDVGGDTSSRAEIAGQFLLMTEAVEARAASTKLKQLTRSDEELKAILADPGHPAIEAAWKRADELHNFLSPTEHIRRLVLPERLSPPRTPSLRALKLWWDKLEELDMTLSRLEAGRERFKADVEHFQKNLKRRTNEQLNYWRNQPESERPDYYVNFVALAERCVRPVESVRPEELLQLVELLEQDDRLRKQRP